MRYLAPVWLLLYGGSLLYVGWRVRRAGAKRRPLYILLSLWCALSLGFTVVADAPYTLVYYLPLLPAPCIALALMWKQMTDGFPQFRLPVAIAVLVLCTLNLNAVWSIEQYIRSKIRKMDVMGHALSLDSLVYPPPLVWQMEIAGEIHLLLDAGDASELIFLQYASPFEGQYRMRLPFIYPERAALYLRNESNLRHNGDYAEEFEFRREVGPYHLYRLPGNVTHAPQILLPERPAYENGLRLLGYDKLGCNGNWQLHWTPGSPGRKGEPVHFFVHLLDAESEILAQRDLRTYDVRDWREGDNIVTNFDFREELWGLPIETIRVGLYLFSDKTNSYLEGINALDELGRPWEYAVDIPFAGECAA